MKLAKHHVKIVNLESTIVLLVPQAARTVKMEVSTLRSHYLVVTLYVRTSRCYFKVQTVVALEEGIGIA
tara:strand:+ start:258 stop:464 length:207 start_codon:yes stop_codon:yes gene_type:complete